jgi:nitrite reductase (NO-forming)
MRVARSAVVLISVLALAACTPTGARPGWTHDPGIGGGGAHTAAPGASGAAPSPDESGHGGGTAAGTLEITSVDLGFTPKELLVDEPGTYEVRLTNDGAIPHDITFPGGQTTTVQPGETGSVTVDVPADGLQFICSIPGHADAGMQGAISVKGTTAGGGGGGDHGGPAPATDVQPDPEAPPYVPYDASAPGLLEGTTHDIDLVIQEKQMTVASGTDGGFVQAVWTFGGTVPGPVIRVKVGDTIRVHLVNPPESQLAHSIDFHASQVAWNDEMTSINPGEEKVYEWRADYAGVWMYHCGTSPALHHIANGMYGMVIVEPREGLPPVDAEFAIVQSEWYLGPQGQPVSLTKASAAAPAPDFVVFNGVASQYVDHPLEVGTGDRVRVFVLNAGPSVDSSFHVVGTIFSSVTKEGVHLVPGNDGSWGSQAMDLSPAQGGIVEFEMPEDGLYPMVTHAFNFVGRGALGLFQAGDGDPLN